MTGRVAGDADVDGGGTITSLVCLAIMSAPWILGSGVGYVLLQFFNIAHGPAQGLIPDWCLPTATPGLGYKNPDGRPVVTSLVAGQLMDSDNPTLAFALMAGADRAQQSRSTTHEKPNETPATAQETIIPADLGAIGLRRCWSPPPILLASTS